MKRRYKIVNKARFYLFLISMFVIMVIGALSIDKVYGSIYEYDYDEVIIVEGDTLWDIALNYMPPKYDVREMIYIIREFNKMETSQIYAGDTIKIPYISE